MQQTKKRSKLSFRCNLLSCFSKTINKHSKETPKKDVQKNEATPPVTPEKEVSNTKNKLKKCDPKDTHNHQISNDQTLCEEQGSIEEGSTYEEEEEMEEKMEDSMIVEVVCDKNEVIEEDNSIQTNHDCEVELVLQQNEPLKWKAVIDKESNQIYYYHVETKETTWTRPEHYEPPDGFPLTQFHKRMELAKMIHELNPLDIEANNALMYSYLGREDELYGKLKELIDFEKPFDEEPSSIPLDLATTPELATVDNTLTINEDPLKEQKNTFQATSMNEEGDLQAPIKEDDDSLQAHIQEEEDDVSLQVTEDENALQATIKEEEGYESLQVTEDEGETALQITMKEEEDDEEVQKEEASQNRLEVPMKEEEIKPGTTTCNLIRNNQSLSEESSSSSSSKDNSQRISIDSLLKNEPRKRNLVAEEFSGSGYALKSEAYSTSMIKNIVDCSDDELASFFSKKSNPSTLIIKDDESELSSFGPFLEKKKQFPLLSLSKQQSDLPVIEAPLPQHKHNQLEAEHWRQTDLDLFISQNDWASVMKYIHTIQTTNTTTTTTTTKRIKPKKTLGARSKLQHGEIEYYTN